MHTPRWLSVVVTIGMLLGSVSASVASTATALTVLTLHDLPPGFTGPALLTLLPAPGATFANATYQGKSTAAQPIMLEIMIYQFPSAKEATTTWPSAVYVEKAADGIALVPLTITAGIRSMSSASYVAATRMSYEDENFLYGSYICQLKFGSPASSQTRLSAQYPHLLQEVTTLIYGRLAGKLKAPVPVYAQKGAAPNAQKVNLTLADLPKGFTVRFAVAKTHIQSARVGGLPVTDAMNGTLLSYSDNGFATKGETGLVGIQATVGVFPNQADAAKDVQTGVSNFYTAPGVTARDTGALGTDSIAFSGLVAKNGRSLWWEGIFFYRGPYEVIVQADSTTAAGSTQAYAFAKIIDARILTHG